MMYERIRKHRHEELRSRICMYLDLFNQYSNVDKYNKLFNTQREEIVYLNPNAEGAVIKQYFGQYFAHNSTTDSQILYPLNLAHDTNVYNSYMKDILKLTDSYKLIHLPKKTFGIKDCVKNTPAISVLNKLNTTIESEYGVFMNFPVVKAPKETQIDYEITVFEYLDECLGACYKTYNLYCSVGLN